MVKLEEFLKANSLKSFSIQENYQMAYQLLELFRQSSDAGQKVKLKEIIAYLKDQLRGKVAFPLAVLLECHLLNVQGTSGSWNNVARHKQLSLLTNLYKEFKGKVPATIWNQICFDYATALRNTGRAIEALRILEDMLEEPEDPTYRRIEGEIGWTLVFVARYLQNHSEKAACLLVAKKHLRSYLEGEADKSLHPLYNDYLEMAESLYCQLGVKDITETSGGNSIKGKEKKYRNWCKENRLNLNVFNEINPEKAMNREQVGYRICKKSGLEGKSLEHFLNSITQEYLALRWLLYDTMKQNSSSSHIGDAPFNHPDRLYVYSIRNELLKTVYRMAYSLFDKIAYFLKQYYNLTLPNQKATLQYIWYVDENPRKQLKPVFKNSTNDALKSLYWLSKELYGYEQQVEDSAFFKKASRIRNMLEHSYLQIMKTKEIMPRDESGLRLDFGSFKSQISNFQSHHLSEQELEQMTMDLTKNARNALLYLRFTIDLEEQGG